MSWTYDPATDAGQVRLLCTDTDIAHQIFSDEEITAFLTIGGGNTKLAAAYALEAFANSQVKILKRIKMLDLDVDGPAVAAELRASAKALREADAADAVFDVAEQVHNAFSARERWLKQFQRGVL